jgi:hypothetical protein
LVALVAAFVAYKASLTQSATALRAAQKQAEATVHAQELAAELRDNEERARIEHRNAAIRLQLGAFAYSAMGSAIYVMTDTILPSDFGEHIRLLQRLIDRLNALDCAEALETSQQAEALWESGHLEAALINLRRRWSTGDQSDENKKWIQYAALRAFDSVLLVAQALDNTDIQRIGQETKQKHSALMEELRRFREQNR